jgi:hypothetical protein
MPDARCGFARLQGIRAQSSDAQHSQAGCRVPTREFRVEYRAVGASHVQAVLAAQRARTREHDVLLIDDSTRRTPTPMNLDD